MGASLYIRLLFYQVIRMVEDHKCNLMKKIERGNPELENVLHTQYMYRQSCLN